MGSRMIKKFIIIGVSSILVGCASRTKPAPIVNVTKVPSYLATKPTTATALASTNSGTTLGNLEHNDEVTTTSTVKNDQTSKLATPAKANSSIAKEAHTATVPSDQNRKWISPTYGKIVQKFSATTKGVDYTGDVEQSIVAVNDGKVVYSGNGLKGYGNLIIIKHDKTYLSAYADNQNNLVKEGDLVKRGQKIATMGKVNGKPLLHFEIRQNGKPIDPVILLQGS